MMGRIKLDTEKWRIVGIYVNGDMESKLRKLEDWMEDKIENCRMIVGV